MAHEDLDFNLYDTYYISYTQERRRFIEDCDQFWELKKSGITVSRALHDIFSNDTIGLVLCSEYISVELEGI